MKIIYSKNIPTIPVSHEDPKNPSAVKKVLLEHKDDISGTIQMINWATLLPHKSLLRHHHKDMKEIFIIISGSSELIVDGRKSILHAGDMAIIEYGEQHTLHNVKNAPVRYIVVGIIPNS